MSKTISVYGKKLGAAARKLPRRFAAYWHRNWWHKAVVIFVGVLAVCLGTMYGIARWYIASESGTPQVLGVSFIPAYAESLGLDAQQTMDGLIRDVGVRHFRLVSYWDQLEPQKGQYDFSLLDWQFQKAEAAHASISLSLGLRQPRWPECHMPAWAAGEPQSQWQPQLQAFIGAVVARYKNSPSLESYQLENEFFLANFGTCTNFDRARLVSEYNFVKRLDPTHPIILSRSTNSPSLGLGKPVPDLYGVSVYRRVWDAQITHRYFEYPFPSWYYAGLAGLQKIITGRDSVIHELQAEAWPPNGKNITQVSLAEQNKSFDAQRFKDRVAFGKATGMREVDLWGAEYWYYRLVKLHDPSLWAVAQQAFQPGP